MVKRGSVCSHPSRPEIDRGPWAGVKLYRAGRGRPSSADAPAALLELELTPGHLAT